MQMLNGHAITISTRSAPTETTVRFLLTPVFLWFVLAQLGNRETERAIHEKKGHALPIMAIDKFAGHPLKVPPRSEDPRLTQNHRCQFWVLSLGFDQEEAWQLLLRIQSEVVTNNLAMSSFCSAFQDRQSGPQKNTQFSSLSPRQGRPERLFRRHRKTNET